MAQRKQGNRLKQRVSGSVQFVVGEDDDLIRWWRSYENGDRQANVKRLLREALKYPQPPTKPIYVTADYLAEWTTYFESLINNAPNRPQQITKAVVTHHEIGDDDVGEDELAERERRMRKVKW